MVERVGVSATAWSWAVATNSSANAKRSSIERNLTNRVMRWADANKFARVNVERRFEVSASTHLAIWSRALSVSMSGGMEEIVWTVDYTSPDSGVVMMY